MLLDAHLNAPPLIVAAIPGNVSHFRASNTTTMRLELTPEAAEYLRTLTRPVALDYIGALG